MSVGAVKRLSKTLMAFGKGHFIAGVPMVSAPNIYNALEISAFKQTNLFGTLWAKKISSLSMKSMIPFRSSPRSFNWTQGKNTPGIGKDSGKYGTLGWSMFKFWELHLCDRLPRDPPPPAPTSLDDAPVGFRVPFVGVLT